MGFFYGIYSAIFLLLVYGTTMRAVKRQSKKGSIQILNAVNIGQSIIFIFFQLLF